MTHVLPELCERALLRCCDPNHCDEHHLRHVARGDRAFATPMSSRQQNGLPVEDLVFHGLGAQCNLNYNLKCTACNGLTPDPKRTAL